MIIKTVKPPLFSYSCGVARTCGEGSCYKSTISQKFALFQKRTKLGSGGLEVQGPETETQTLFDIFSILRSS